MAGQGLNMGIADAVQLTVTLQGGIESGTDIGDVHLLREDERARRRDNTLMLGVLDALKQGFGASAGPAPAVRALGLLALDRFLPGKIKSKMVQLVSGLGAINAANLVQNLGTAQPKLKQA